MTRLYAQELMQYDDRALDAYLATVNNVIQIHDAENLTPEFLERLRHFYDPETRTEAAPKLNLDLVSAKLAQTLTKSGRRRISSPTSQNELDEDDYLEYNIQQEEDGYENLVSDGGRPLFDISRLRDVARDPAAHHELLSPLLASGNTLYPSSWQVFVGQERQWIAFRWRQKDMRQTDELLAELNETAAQRRALVGLARPFTFLRDARQQDKLTTWAEYLDYECASYVSRRRGKLERFLDERNLPRTRYINWVLAQFPLIDEEMAQEKSSLPNSSPIANAEPPTSPSKRHRDVENEQAVGSGLPADIAPRAKKTRLSFSAQPKLRAGEQPQPVAGKRKSRSSGSKDTTEAPAPRRSARIATRAEKLQLASDPTLAEGGKPTETTRSAKIASTATASHPTTMPGAPAASTTVAKSKARSKTRSASNATKAAAPSAASQPKRKARARGTDKAQTTGSIKPSEAASKIDSKKVVKETKRKLAPKSELLPKPKPSGPKGRTRHRA